MVCRICHRNSHNRATCKYNNEITSCRPGPVRKRCKKNPTDKRKLRVLSIFTQKETGKPMKCSDIYLKRAKKKSMEIFE